MFFNDSSEKKKCLKCGYFLVAPFPLNCPKCKERIPGVEEPKKKTRRMLNKEKEGKVEKKIFSILSDDPVYIDDIVMKSGLRHQEILSILLKWECRAKIKRIPGNYFVLTA